MKKVVAGNWKMNTSLDEGLTLAREIVADYYSGGNVDLILAPPFTHLSAVSEILTGVSGIFLAAQDSSSEEKGAFTGEISAGMIKSCGASHVIIGHSERRTLFSEGNDILNKKLERAWAAGLTPIFCCGETLEERESGRYWEVIENQLRETILNRKSLPGKLIVAYEPVWAIGTGKTASAQQAGEVHAFIHELLVPLSAEIPVLYGGSCKPDNASELFATEGIDGGLIGGASLDAESFLKIAAAAAKSV